MRLALPPVAARLQDPLHRVGVHLRSRLAVPVVVVGVVGGLAGAGYVAALRLLQRWLWPDGHGVALQAVILVGAGLGIVVLRRLVGPPGSVELLVDNIHVLGGAEGYRETAAIVPTSLLGIAAGGAIGPEAPLVETTGTLGTAVARRWHVDAVGVRTLTITGMAAGFAALFGAPLGAAFFALEILHRRGLQYYEALIPAMVGALAGYVVYAGLTGVGIEPVWPIGVHDAPTALTVGDLGWAVVGATVGAALAYAFVGLATLGTRAMRPVPEAVRPVVGGALLAALAWWSPYALTYGEAQGSDLLRAGLALGALLVALAAKLLAVTVTQAAGWKGGFVIPLFFCAIALGLALHTIVPSANEAVVVTAVMVAAVAGVTKTPVGSALVVTEMAGLVLGPTTAVAAVVGLVLTRPIGMIRTQRPRITTDLPSASVGTGEVTRGDGTGKVPPGEITRGDGTGAEATGAAPFAGGADGRPRDGRRALPLPGDPDVDDGRPDVTGAPR